LKPFKSAEFIEEAFQRFLVILGIDFIETVEENADVLFTCREHIKSNIKKFVV
jgi:2-polyprenyl-3-methyl-5-hydroxy-6-metoxy-1,4-benzoquinol methylase